MLVLDFFNEMWIFLNQISIYLVFGFLIAGILSVCISKDFIERNLGEASGLSSVLKACILGVPLPLCSCSVIPVSASLKKHGASKGAISSFLLSTPQTGVDSIMVTYGVFGPLFALIRPIVALITGFLGGTFVYFFDNQYSSDIQPQCQESCCSKKQKSTIQRILSYSFITLPKDIAKPLIYGITIASFINLILPDNIIVDVVGNGFLSMIFMIVIGTPLYVCATASIPIAVAMISKGATVGAAMVFLMVGPATNITSLSTMLEILGKKSTAITLSVLIMVSLFFGYLVDNVSFIYNDTMSHCMESHESFTFIDYFSTVLLLCVLFYSILGDRLKKV